MPCDTSSMRPVSTILVALLLAATPGAVTHAQSDEAPPPSPSERLQEGAIAIIDGLRMLMDQLQSYQSPEVLPNGDIIIRRNPPADADQPPPLRHAEPIPDHQPRTPCTTTYPIPPPTPYQPFK